MLADLEKGIGRLVEEPQVGHPRSDLTKRKLLFYRAHSYLIIYCKEKVPLHVVRVLHSARDVGGELEE